MGAEDRLNGLRAAGSESTAARRTAEGTRTGTAGPAASERIGRWLTASGSAGLARAASLTGTAALARRLGAGRALARSLNLRCVDERPLVVMAAAVVEANR